MSPLLEFMEHSFKYITIILSDLLPLINTVNMAKSYMGNFKSQHNLIGSGNHIYFIQTRGLTILQIHDLIWLFNFKVTIQFRYFFSALMDRPLLDYCIWIGKDQQIIMS